MSNMLDDLFTGHHDKRQHTIPYQPIDHHHHEDDVNTDTNTNTLPPAPSSTNYNTTTAHTTTSTPSKNPSPCSYDLPLKEDHALHPNHYHSPSGTTTTRTTTADVASIMQPSAKTILEQRARAKAEGRRQDAKLSEAEQHIVRRLRNWESLKRCRLRRVEHARLLEPKMSIMKQENDHLVAQVQRYEVTMIELERIIHENSNGKQRARGDGPPGGEQVGEHGQHGH